MISPSLAARLELIEALILRDIRARYAQSLLGIAWALLYPLALSLIQAAVMVFVLRIDTTIPVVVFTYAGNLFWTLFSNGLSGATDSLVGHMNLVGRLRFPREALPLAAVLGRLPDFAFGLIGLAALVVIFPVAIGPGLLLVPALLLVQIVFTAGIALMTSSANVFYRDIRHIVALVLTLWYYLVPVLYSVELIPPEFRTIYLANPMAAIIDTSRRLMFPEIGQTIDWQPMGLAVIVAVATFTVGLWVFRRAEPRFAEAI
jgi:lipopolysaccharide transport system permease protein